MVVAEAEGVKPRSTTQGRREPSQVLVFHLALVAQLNLWLTPAVPRPYSKPVRGVNAILKLYFRSHEGPASKVLLE